MAIQLSTSQGTMDIYVELFERVKSLGARRPDYLILSDLAYSRVWNKGSSYRTQFSMQRVCDISSRNDSTKPPCRRRKTSYIGSANKSPEKKAR
jgi:hypothetical protein